MGMSPSAHLIYGYDIGGTGEGWKIREDMDSLSWVTDSVYGVSWDAEAHLMRTVAGFTEERGDRSHQQATEDGYFQRYRAAHERVGVELFRYGYNEEPSYVLGAHQEWVGDYGSTPVDLTKLVMHPDGSQWNTRLAAAIKALGITPEQDRPRWILAAAYG